MKRDVVTLRLDEDLKRVLDKVCQHFGRSRNEIVREALERHLVQRTFEQLRRRVMPFAEARGYLIDKDVFKEIS